jgi:hypothetical protein
MSDSRVLAVDLRSRLFGFAVLEGPKILLDFGRRPCHTVVGWGNALIVRRKIADLLAFYAPSIIVLKPASGRSGQPLLKTKDAVDAIRSEAELRSLDLAFLTRKDIHQVFRQSGNSNKYKIAGLITHIFPELAWKLPANRKNWQPEHHNMAIFDAVSLGLAYFAQSRNIPLTQLEAFQTRVSG